MSRTDAHRERQADARFNVLFLCTGNSCRSIMAESVLSHLGGARYAAFSAGSDPVGEVNPGAIAELQRQGYPTAGLYSKHVNEFIGVGAPPMHFVFTVCDQAAEACPLWPRSTLVTHWGVADPARANGDADRRAAAFATALQALQRRIACFLDLKFRSITDRELPEQLRAIGAMDDAG